MEARDLRPLIVGESNPYQSSGCSDEFALYPSPDGCSGHRLCVKILGMSRQTYMQVFDRCNLCSGPWRIKAARLKVAEVLERRTKYILLGAKVSQAFDVPFVPFEISEGGTMLVIPHPSGLCRIWTQADAVDRARKAVSLFVPELVPMMGVV